jgi:hypothetical protein
MKNWSGNIEYNPSNIAMPKNISELQKVVSDASKVLITVGVFLTLPLNRTFWRPLPHQATLHAALDGLPGAHAQP